jgi:glyoxylase-like metal-dependent hydrolase (beta-lactamase superfamily II)/8-oxo-dGTP pyrophosphatase MutT (NUDIX family)
MSELPPGIEPAQVPEPRESACGIACRRTAAGWRVLVGLRSKSSKFMPDHVAFPGGRLDAADEPDRVGAHARSAAREVREETGIAIEPAGWLAAGARVTPPLFPVRFRTEFFVAALPDGTPDRPAPATPENQELSVASAESVLDDWTRGACRVPPPVLPILRAIATAPPTIEELAAAVAAANAEEERAARIEFAPGLWVHPMATRTLPPATHTNAWIVGGERFVVVDPGSDESSEREKLLAVVERRRALGHTPAAIVLTHHHADHVGGVRWFHRALEVPVRAHRMTLRQIGTFERAVPMGGGDTIALGGMTLRAIETPGHAAGHLALHLPEAEAIVVGDLVSGLSTILVDPETGDMDDYLASLERIRDVPCRVLLPGHGPPVPPTALGRLLEHRRRREARIVARLDVGAATLSEIAAAAYPEETAMPRVLLERQTLAHLVALERRGLARRRDDAWASR